MADLVINNIESAKPRGWFLLQVTDKPSLLVNEEIVFKYSLRAGLAIAESFYWKIKREADINWLKAKGQQILARRMVSERDLRRKLTEEHRPKAVREEVIAQLREYGFINDAQYASSYIRSQLLKSPKSKLFLKKKLWEKGINPEIAEAAIDAEMEEVDEVAGVRALAEKKYKTLQHLPSRQAKTRLINFLRSRGFKWDTIKAAIEGIIDGEIATDEMES